MYYEDLSNYCYQLPFSLPNVKMIGWLDWLQPYPHGQVERKIIEKLWKLICTRPVPFDLEVNIVRGTDPCKICDTDIQYIDLSRNSMLLGMSEIWIPYGLNWYAAPSLIAHYMEDHHYLPPKEFLEAIEAFDCDSNENSQMAFDKMVTRAT